jgi:penicillin-binding protein 1A
MTFDKVSKKKATDCTPDAAKVNISVQTVTDPITKTQTYVAPDGYDPTSSDDKHQCSDVKPYVSLSAPTAAVGPAHYTITAHVNAGTFTLQHVTISVDGNSILDQDISSAGDYSAEYTFTKNGTSTITATVTDQGYYAASVNQSVTVTGETSYVPQSNPIADIAGSDNGRRPGRNSKSLF